MAFTGRRRKTERKRTAHPAVRIEPDAALRVEGQRLEHFCYATTLRITCACGHQGILPVSALRDRYPRGTRISEVLGHVRCSRCQGSRIQSVKTLD